MKELLKNKFMIAIMVFMLGVSFVDSTNHQAKGMTEEKTEIMYYETK
jgi:hypothetical protein